MTSLVFPDLNVWLALVLADHAHRQLAKTWWENDESDTLAFLRLTQLGLLRLLTTASVMNGQPLTMPEAWAAYDRLFADERVAYLDEPEGVETALRGRTDAVEASPKLWADAWLLACSELHQGTIVTFDRALASRAEGSLLLSATR